MSVTWSSDAHMSIDIDDGFWQAYGSLSPLYMSKELNRLLLKTQALLNLMSPECGLIFAETALCLAEQNKIYTIESKAQLYRGICLLDLGYPAEASWCFTRAASICGFARDVERWKTKAEKMRSALDLDNPRRKIAKEFRTVPVETSVKWSSLCS